MSAPQVEPHELLRDVLAEQVLEGMRPSMNPELVDLLSDEEAESMALLSSRLLTAHRHDTSRNRRAR